MAKLISLDRLEKFKDLVDLELAKKYQSITYDSSTRTVKFFKGADTTGTADFTITLPEDVDISGKIDKVASPTAGNFVTVKSDGSLQDAGVNGSSFATAAQGTKADNAESAIAILNGNATTAGSVAKSIGDAITALNLGSASQAEVEATGVASDTTTLPTTAQVKAYVDAQVGALNQFDYEVVASLPTASADTMYKIWLVSNGGSSSNVYDEYITVRSGSEGSYTYSNEKIGTTAVDLSGYVAKTTTIAGVDLQDNITKAELLTALNVADDADVNVLESVSVGGDALTITNKGVNIELASIAEIEALFS